MMMTRTEWQHLIPHQGAMCLLDAVIEWDDGHIHARAVSHRDPDNPLRGDGRLHGVNLCEYGAQAMALHGGLRAQRDARIAQSGTLVSLRDVKLYAARIDDLAGVLDIHADKLLDGGTSWQYAFRVEHAGRLLAEGRAAVILATTGMRG